MTLSARFRRLSAMLAAAALIAAASPVHAQDISESHLKAAHDAISAIHATDQFDVILPQAAASLQGQLIQKNPDMNQLISKTVSEKALALASRRADLEHEAALAYAKLFSEKELQEIAAFYQSEAGKKLLEKGPIAVRDLTKAATIWQNGIARDLAQQVGEALAAAAETKAPAPAEGAAPADGAAAPAPAGEEAPKN
jgi:hypothetical protein